MNVNVQKVDDRLFWGKYYIKKNHFNIFQQSLCWIQIQDLRFTSPMSQTTELYGYTTISMKTISQNILIAIL